MKPIQLIAPLALALVLLSGIAAHATEGDRSVQTKDAVVKADRGTPAVRSNYKLDHLLRGQASPHWSRVVRISTLPDPCPGCPGYGGTCDTIGCPDGPSGDPICEAQGNLQGIRCTTCGYDAGTGFRRCS